MRKAFSLLRFDLLTTNDASRGTPLHPSLVCVFINSKLIKSTFVKRVVLASWKSLSHKQKTVFRTVSLLFAHLILLCGLRKARFDSVNGNSLCNLKDLQARKKHLPSRLKRIVVQNASKHLTNAKPRKSSLFHAWRYLSCRRKCFAGFHFCSHAKKVVKTTRLSRRNFLVVSLVRPLKPIFLCFPACWKSQMRTSQTRLSTCLFVTLPFHHLNAASWQSSSPNQSQDAEKPYHIEQIKAKTRKSLTNTRVQRRNEIWKLVILHLFFA